MTLWQKFLKYVHMKYDLLFFDADDTLLDFKRSEDISFQIILKKHGILDTDKSLHQSYKIINHRLWTEHAEGKVSKDFLKVERFKKFLETNNLNADPHKLSDDYSQTLPDNVFLIEGALELLQSLYQKIPLIIITNGIGETQYKRLHNSGLKSLIDLMVVSEECGYSKPDQRIFNHAFKLLEKNHLTSRTLMIGDKLETDILGANNMGIDSCWYNPEKDRNNTSIVPTYEIHKLSDLFKII